MDQDKIQQNTPPQPNDTPIQSPEVVQPLNQQPNTQQQPSQPLQPNQVPQPVTTPPQPKSRSPLKLALLIVGGIFGAIVVVGIIVGFVTSVRDGIEEASNGSESSQVGNKSQEEKSAE